MLFWRKINDSSKKSTHNEPANLPDERIVFYNKKQSEMFKKRFSTNNKVKKSVNYQPAYMVDRKSVFYDKEQSERFKKKFHIDLSTNDNEVSVIKDNKQLYNGEIVEETDTHVLIKKKIYKK